MCKATSDAAPEGWVSKRVVARHFGVCTRTVENWGSRGCPRLKGRNGLRRYRLSEMEDWLRELGGEHDEPNQGPQKEGADGDHQAQER